MKIAVVFSGEYRTFKICRKTMPFLDYKDIDIYFSTWPISTYNINCIKLKKFQIIKKSTILNDLGRSAIISYGNPNLFRNNLERMIDRWINGLELVRQANIDYDRILIIRPDLFFGPNIFSINQIPTGFNIAWNTGVNLLNDYLILGDFNTISKVINDNLMLSVSKHSQHCAQLGIAQNWHKYWFDYVNKTLHSNFNIFDIGDIGVICRYYAAETNTYQEIDNIDKDYIMLKYIDSSNQFGDDIMLQINPEGLNLAKKLWVEGYFKKYVNI